MKRFHCLFLTLFLFLDSSPTPQISHKHSGFNWLLLTTIAGGLVLASILIWYLNQHRYKSRFVNRYPVLGGWLVLVGIGTMITPLSYLLEIYWQWNSQKNINYFYYFFHDESDSFSPFKGYYTLFAIFFDVIMLVYAVFLVTIFFQRRASFRIHYLLFKIITLLLLTLDVFLIYKGYSSSGSVNTTRMLTRETVSLAGLFISACIWVPYIWFSERSKHTFTNETGDEEEYGTETSQQQL